MLLLVLKISTYTYNSFAMFSSGFQREYGFKQPSLKQLESSICGTLYSLSPASLPWVSAVPARGTVRMHILPV